MQRHRDRRHCSEGQRQRQGLVRKEKGKGKDKGKFGGKGNVSQNWNHSWNNQSSTGGKGR